MWGMFFGSRPAGSAVVQVSPAPMVNGRVRHEARWAEAAADPCGGAWWRDCSCGARCPIFRTEDEANAWLAQHIAEAAEENAA